jgi:hypothetical protein
VAVCTVPAAGARPALVDRTCRLGSAYVITGQTGTIALSHRHLPGMITLRGSWNGGRWRVIDTDRANPQTGTYRLVVRPTHRGVLRLRLLTPDAITYSMALTIV